MVSGFAVFLGAIGLMAWTLIALMGIPAVAKMNWPTADHFETMGWSFTVWLVGVFVVCVGIAHTA